MHTDDWRQKAVCRGMDPNLFFPARGQWQAVLAIKQICGGCPVKQQCLEYGISNDMNYGVDAGFYGGLSGRGRREHRKAIRLAARRQVAA